jgi:hypothetical protein
MDSLLDINLDTIDHSEEQAIALGNVLKTTLVDSNDNALHLFRLSQFVIRSFDFIQCNIWLSFPVKGEIGIYPDSPG